MEKRVKIFAAGGDDSEDRLEYKINEFLAKSKGKLHDLKFSVSQSEDESYVHYTNYALLIYTPKES